MPKRGCCWQGHCWRRGDAVGAETEVRKAIDLKYAGDDAFPLLGRALIQQREFQKVISELSETKLADPQAQADLSASLAFAYIGLGKVPDARAAIDAALAASPALSSRADGASADRCRGERPAGAPSN